MNTAIETRHLSKTYGNVHAVEELSLQVNEGEIYAFLGLNGAGKTTTIRMLLGMVKASQGEVSVLGQAVRPGGTQPWAEVGYLVETPHAYPELSVRENLEVARRLHPGTPAGAVDEAITLLNLGEYAERRAGHLSLGNKQRLGLAKALVHQPRLLLLDEPANGLDPAGIVEIRQLLRQRANEQGVTIFMCSHILGEVARLAQRIGIIHHGRLLQELDVAELERNRRRWLQVSTSDSASSLQILNDHGLPAKLNGDNSIQVTAAKAIQQPEMVASLLVGAGQALRYLTPVEEDLEEYFLRLIGMELNEQIQ